ncbi:hypothetical protein SAMN05216558_3149 [Pseudomonas vancouverensis]|nr:hypothetical protein SAMN05216558_3149 [Pseudomonas vancouverensis]
MVNNYQAALSVSLQQISQSIVRCIKSNSFSSYFLDDVTHQRAKHWIIFNNDDLSFNRQYSFPIYVHAASP